MNRKFRVVPCQDRCRTRDMCNLMKHDNFNISLKQLFKILAEEEAQYFQFKFYVYVVKDILSFHDNNFYI